MGRFALVSRRPSSLIVLFALLMSLLPPGAIAQDDDPPPVAASLVIHVSGTDGASLSDATFVVTDANGGSHTVSSSGGMAMLFDLPPGWTTAVQTAAPAGYTFSGVAQGATIAPGSTAEIWVINTALPPDSDGDGIPDAEDSTPYGELDSDEVPDDIDNCPTVNNPDQADADSDGLGDACDDTPLPPAPDADGDGTPDAEDPTPNGEQDSDNIPDDTDNCPTINNPDQSDANGDGVGDACATDDSEQEVSVFAVWDITVFAGVRNNTVNGDFNGPFLSNASASPGQDISFAMLITNPGSEPISNISVTSTIPGEIVLNTGAYNQGLSCDTPSAFPATVGCSVTTIPYDNLSTLGLYFHTKVVAFPSAEACENGIEMTATITSIEGETVFMTSTAHLDLDCPDPVTPALPSVTDASCVNGVYQAPVITEAETPGVIYSYSPSLEQVEASGGTLTITASLREGITWGQIGEGWTPDGESYQATVEVDAPACLAVTKTAEVRDTPGGSILSTTTVETGNQVIYRITISNTGGSDGSYQLTDWLSSSLEVMSVSPGAGTTCTSGIGVGGGFSCGGSLPRNSMRTFIINTSVPVPSQSDCQSGFDNFATGRDTTTLVDFTSNTVHLDLACDTVAPELPTVAQASCVDGVYTAPNITGAETPGINYEYSPSLDEIEETGGSLSIMATKDPEPFWNADPAVWTVDGDRATAAIEIVAPPCLSIVKMTSLTGDAGDWATAPVTAGPNQVVGFQMTISNTGASTASYQVTDTIASPLTPVGMSWPGDLFDCPDLGQTVVCGGSLPAGASQSLEIATMVGLPTEDECASGVDNTAYVTSIDGGEVSIPSNTVHVALDCDFVILELPDITHGDCVDGVYTAPTITEVETEGVTYTYSPSLEAIVASGGTLTITATKAQDVDWFADSWFWTVDGDTAVATIDVFAPPCISITKAVSVDGGPASTTGVASPGSTVKFFLVVTNSGGSAPEFSLQDSFTPYLVARSGTGQINGGPQLRADCSISFVPGSPIFECTGILGPGGKLEPSVELRVPENLTASQCASGIDNTAYVTSVGEETVSIPSNTVHVSLNCPVAPELPSVTDGSCLDGVYTAPVITLAETGDITYDSEWGPADRIDGKRTLTVTATKPSTVAWEVDPAIWTVDGDTASATLDVVAPPCMSVVKTVSIDGGSDVTAGIAEPGDQLVYRMTVTNTGESSGGFGLDDTFPPMLTWSNYAGVYYASLQSYVVCNGSYSTAFTELAITCYGVLEPGVSITPDATLHATGITPDICASGIDNTANLSSWAGTLASNTVHVDFDCATVTPELPVTSDGSCVAGVYTAPTFTEASTEGLTYSYDRTIEDLLASGGDLVITATLDNGSLWGEVDEEVWTVDGSTATATIAIETPPCFAFAKEIASGEGPYAVDDVIAYDLTVTNTGTIPLTGVAIADLLIADLTCAIDGIPATLPATLNATEILACAGSHTVTQPEIDLGAPLVNTATASTSEAGSLTASATATLVDQEPGISFTKSVDPTVVSAPGTVTYTFVIENIGNVTLTNVVLDDSLIDLAEVDCDPATGIQGVPSSLAVGGEVTCTVPYEIGQEEIDARQPMTNTARVTSDQVTSNDASATVTVVPADSLSLVKSVEPKTVDSPGPVTFTFVVQNAGSASLSGVELVDPLIDLAQVDCDPADGIQGFPITLAANSAPITCTVPYEITQSDIDAGTAIINTAQVTSDQADSNEASATISIVQQPDLAVTKTVTSASSGLDQGDVVTYEIVVTNSGNVTLTELAVTDPGADTLDCETIPESFAPGETITCEASTELTEADLLAGSYTNTVTASAMVPTPETDLLSFAQAAPLRLEATASATVTLVLVEPGLSIEKSVDPVGPVDAGDTLTYTFAVTNTGNVTVEDVTIEDPLTGLAWDASGGAIGDLARGEEVTVTATYLVTPADAKAGTVTNTASANGQQPGCDLTAIPGVRFFQASNDCTVVSNESSAAVIVESPPPPVTETPTEVPTETPAVPMTETPTSTVAPQTPKPTAPAGTPGAVTTLPTTGQGPDQGPLAISLSLLLVAFGLALIAAGTRQHPRFQPLARAARNRLRD